MTPNEKKLAARLLKMAASTYSNHGCNDIDRELLDGFADEDKVKLMKDYETWNGEFWRDASKPEEAYYMMDTSLMALMAHKLETE